MYITNLMSFLCCAATTNNEQKKKTNRPTHQRRVVVSIYFARANKQHILKLAKKINCFPNALNLPHSMTKKKQFQFVPKPKFTVNNNKN